MRTLGTAVPLLFLVACYDPALEPGKLQCTADGECPEGFECAPNKRCFPRGASVRCDPACSGATAYCDLTRLTCVACLEDAHCPPGFLCAAGTCKPGCNPKKASCAPDAGACDVDLGVCRGCLADAECPDPQNPRCEPASGRCLPCLPQGDNCPAGRYCVDKGAGLYACEAGCKDANDAACKDGASPRCCNHKCVDLAADGANCGACGMACAGGGRCCGMACVDVQQSPLHCGGCDVVCKPDNVEAPLCVAASCDYDRCKAGFGDCDARRQNGCEVSTTTDLKNCGRCGLACGPYPNATPTCANGSCALVACTPGWADCDQTVMNGCEKDVRTDVMNCGACGKSCPNIANGTPQCQASACVPICNQGFRDCDQNFANGCEANLNTDARHCGGCGSTCKMNESCQMGICRVVCQAPRAECDGNAQSVCETDTATDPKHCGACNKPCPTPPNTMAVCAAGQCGGSCVANFGNCDNMLANGCEVDLRVTLAHCGACNKPCAIANGTPRCTNGACTNAGCNAPFADCNNNLADGCETDTSNNSNHCGACGRSCGANGGCGAGSCFTSVGKLGNVEFLKVSVMGAMTDTNIFNACKAAGLRTPCAGQGGCMFNDAACIVTPEAGCGNPMMDLSRTLCGGASPPQCPALFGLFQYMGHKWVDDSGCGAEQNNWCVTGKDVQNKFALCIR